MRRIPALVQGGGLKARAIRSTLFTLVGFGGAQVIRLASNLILTRLLFPEAFGLMALIMVILQGLAMFSDVGVGPAIMQSKRGDETRFLNTAWTIQAARGFVLWIVAALLAYPMSMLYNEPRLFEMMPVLALTLIITGFNPTRLMSANRHLNLGRLTAIDITTQGAGAVCAVILAYLTGSVWSLVASGIFSAALQLVLYWRFLEGISNTFDWERPAARELINFGKWIFLSTVAGFVVSQADKLLLGKFLPIDQFGIYNIAFFLATFPMFLGNVLIHRLLIPVYRERPPGETRANFLALRKMRILVSGALIAFVAIPSFFGVWLAEFLYDPRYHAAGPMVVLLAAMQVPLIIALTYDQAALAAGDSRSYFVLQGARAGVITVGLFVGLEVAGLYGALIAIGVAGLCVYPVVVWLAHRMSAWDPIHDICFFLFGGIMVACALWVNGDSLRALATGG